MVIGVFSGRECLGWRLPLAQGPAEPISFFTVSTAIDPSEVELYVEDGPLRGQRFSFSASKPSLTLGRGVQAGTDIDFTSNDGTQRVGRRHLEISITSDGIIARDLHTHNGTLINGQDLRGGASTRIKLGTRIHLAPPEGPRLIVQSKARAVDDSAEAKKTVQRLREECEELRRTCTASQRERDELRRERDSLQARLQASQGAVQPAAAPEIDWEEVELYLSDFAKRVSALQALGDKASADFVATELAKISFRLEELRGLLSNGRPR